VSHHLGSPASRRDPRLNVTDVYAFDSDDATVLAMIVNSSLAGAGRVPGFHPEGRYEFKIHLDGAAAEQLTYRFSFTPADAAGAQRVAVDRLAGPDAGDDRADGARIADGGTAEAISGSGLRAWCGAAAGPFYLDLHQLARILEGLQHEQPIEFGEWTPAQAASTFTGSQICAIVLEIPWTDPELRPGRPVGVWAAAKLATDAGGWRQVNRAGLPMVWPLFRALGGDDDSAGYQRDTTALVLLSWSALHLGHWSAAVPAAEEGGRLCAETDQPFWHACALAAHATVAAHRGDFATAGDLVQVAEHVAGPHRFAAAEAVILVTRAATAAGQGEHERAFAHLARLHDPADSAHHPVHGLWSLASLAEAAALGGETDAARRIVARLRPDVRATRSPAGQMNLTYAGAVLAAGNDIETSLRAAIRSEVATWPFERSRLLLAYGAWLRRRQRARESRDYLREARDGFDRLGARPWAERAREELRASGERSNLPATDAWDELSPQELQIASMAIQGLTNREIGERLFISHRTVGSHLYRMFPKLGISSRTELLRLAAERERV
jgi:DNA-binding CsgD family transcriptional regulator